MQARGVGREVLQRPAKLHLTIGMLKLFSQIEKVRCIPMLCTVVHCVVVVVMGHVIVLVFTEG